MQLFILLFHSFHQSAELLQTNTCICWTFPIIYLQGPLFNRTLKAWIIGLTHMGTWVVVAFFLANGHFKRSSCVMWSWVFSLCFTVTLQRKYPVESCFWSHLGCWVCTIYVWNIWFRPFSFSSCCFWQGKKCSKVREFVPVQFENWMAPCLVFFFLKVFCMGLFFEGLWSRM